MSAPAARSCVHCCSAVPAILACVASVSLVLREIHSKVLSGLSSLRAIARPMPREAPVRIKRCWVMAVDVTDKRTGKTCQSLPVPHFRLPARWESAHAGRQSRR